jgi:hypothetical protein
MTAYLQPGDIIHLSVPWSLEDKNFEETQATLEAGYAQQGIRVIFTSESDHRLPVEVVSVIRPVQASPFEDFLPASAD